MNGTIEFNDAESLAAFLAAFTGKSTAVFECKENANGTFTLTFGGGY